MSNLDEIVVGLEQECMTIVDGREHGDSILPLIDRFIASTRARAPSLPCCSGGLFTGYGRIYQDCGAHIELACAECDSPYTLALIAERQQRLVSSALKQMPAKGPQLRLFNNNHGGVLQNGTQTWGSHENYLVARKPASFEAAILPFLATRVYGGAGGVLSPTAEFVAGVRSQFMLRNSGGDTRHDRAIHSTVREEHHMGGAPGRFRYHLLLGDGHRSQFNLALQFGATALVLAAIQGDAAFHARAAAIEALHGSWVRTLRTVNVLAAPGQAPRVAPFALATQRMFLEGTEAYVRAQHDPPVWTLRTLADWRRTLEAFESDDRAWLAAHLDAFAKYELFTSSLAGAGADWGQLPARSDLFARLTLLDHSYHDFTSADSLFERSVEAGLVDHRVGPLIEPGCESEPFVPEVATRAKARARFIAKHAGQTNFVIDWPGVFDRATCRRARLSDPFAREFSAWEPTTLEGDEGLGFFGRRAPRTS